MAVYDCIWLHFVIYGCMRLCMAVHGCVWVHVWLYLVVSGSISLYMVLYSCMWLYVAVYGYSCIWLYMGVYGYLSLYCRCCGCCGCCATRPHVQRSQNVRFPSPASLMSYTTWAVNLAILCIYLFTCDSIQLSFATILRLFISSDININITRA